MKNSTTKFAATALAAILFLTTLASCSYTNVSNNGANSAPSGSTNADPTENDPSNTDSTASAPTLRYGISNGQWGQFSKYTYNERGQLTAVTAISPFTLAPLCYETIKLDRMYIYNDDGTLDRIWLNQGITFNISTSADGRTAEGSSTKNGDTFSVKLTFSDNKILLKEEYTLSSDSLINEYDVNGNIVKITQGTGFITTHAYSESKVDISLCRVDGTNVADYSFTYDEANLIEISAQGEKIKLIYENGRCVKGDYNGQIYTIAYDSNGRVTSTSVSADTTVTETYEYTSGSNISKYTREKKSSSSGSWVHDITTCTYTYAEDGTISKQIYQYIEYDRSGNETYRREEEF